MKPATARDVAVKLFSIDQSTDPEQATLIRKFFLTEVLLAQKLRHPNIVQIYDSAVDDNRAYIAMEHVHGTLTYQPNSTHVHTHMRDVLSQRRGVCQDFAHVMIGLCRSLRIPTLYVSGYLATQAASATHAWTEVFVPGVGWQGLDPTHKCQTDETYVKIAVGRDYADVAPVSGTYKGKTERTLSVQVKIARSN